MITEHSNICAQRYLKIMLQDNYWNLLHLEILTKATDGSYALPLHIHTGSETHPAKFIYIYIYILHYVI